MDDGNNIQVTFGANDDGSIQEAIEAQIAQQEKLAATWEKTAAAALDGVGEQVKQAEELTAAIQDAAAAADDSLGSGGSMAAAVEQQIEQAKGLNAAWRQNFDLFKNPVPVPVPNPDDINKSKNAYDEFQKAVLRFRSSQRMQGRAGKYMVSELMEVVPASAEAKRALVGIAGVGLQAFEAIAKIGQAGAGLAAGLVVFEAMKLAVSQLTEAWAKEKKAREDTMTATAEGLRTAKDQARSFARAVTDSRSPLTDAQKAQRASADALESKLAALNLQVDKLKAEDNSRWGITKLLMMNSKAKELASLMEQIAIATESQAKASKDINKWTPGQERESTKRQISGMQGERRTALLKATATAEERIEAEHQNKLEDIRERRRQETLTKDGAAFAVKTAEIEKAKALEELAVQRSNDLQQSRASAEILLRREAGDEQAAIYAETVKQMVAIQQQSQGKALEIVRNEVAAVQAAEDAKIKAYRGTAAARAEANALANAAVGESAGGTEDAKRLGRALGAVGQGGKDDMERAQRVSALEAQFAASVKQAWDAAVSQGNMGLFSNVYDQMSAKFKIMKQNIISGWDEIKENIAGMAGAIGQALGSTFAAMIKGTMGAGEGLRDMLAGALQQAIALAAAMATQALMLTNPWLAYGAIPIAAGLLTGLTALLSAEKGFDIPPGTNPTVQLHQREMVLPAPLADGLRDMIAGGGGAGGGGAVTVNYSVSAMDGPSVYRVLRDNETQLVRIIQNARGNRRI